MLKLCTLYGNASSKSSWTRNCYPEVVSSGRRCKQSLLCGQTVEYSSSLDVPAWILWADFINVNEAQTQGVSKVRKWAGWQAKRITPFKAHDPPPCGEGMGLRNSTLPSNPLKPSKADVAHDWKSAPFRTNYRHISCHLRLYRRTSLDVLPPILCFHHEHTGASCPCLL